MGRLEFLLKPQVAPHGRTAFPLQEPELLPLLRELGLQSLVSRRQALQ